MKRYLALVLTALLLAGCSHASPPAESTPPPSPPPEEDQTVFKPVELPEPEPEPDPRQESIDGLLSSMTVEEKAGQLFFACCPETGGAELAAEYHLGGYLLFKGNLKDRTPQQVQEELAALRDAAGIPLLIGADEEGGTVARVSACSQLREKRFSSPQKLYRQGGLEAILADCREKDELLTSLGISVNFAPVADLSTDPKDFIYDRTLGLGTEETCAYITAVVDQMETDGMGSVLKHFPGYGNNSDTHTGSALDERPLETFRAEDFLPFRAGIEAGGGSTAVLVSHNIVTSMDPDRPASLSPAVYQILRDELGFDGPALTDDLSMKAVAKYAEEQEQSPAVLAIAAGCDMVVTADFKTQIPQILAALEDGTLAQERVDEAVSRVLGWKYDLGLIPREEQTP